MDKQMKKQLPLVSYDEYEITKNQVELLKESGDYPDKSDDELYGMACDDAVIYELEYECIIANLSELLKGRKYFKAIVDNFGWRKLSGYKFFEAESGEQFLREILPSCDCTWYLYKEGKGFRLVNYHHDAPTGETYHIKPITQSAYENNI